MTRASITEAKNGLSALIARVRHGESIIIEDRGVPVARLESVVIPGQRQAEGRADRLRKEGVLRPAVAPVPKHLLVTPPPQPKRGEMLSEAIIAERRDGR